MFYIELIGNELPRANGVELSTAALQFYSFSSSKFGCIDEAYISFYLVLIGASGPLNYTRSRQALKP